MGTLLGEDPYARMASMRSMATRAFAAVSAGTSTRGDRSRNVSRTLARVIYPLSSPGEASDACEEVRRVLSDSSPALTELC